MTAGDAASLLDAYRRETRLSRVLSTRPVVSWYLAAGVAAAWLAVHLGLLVLRHGGFETLDYRAALVFGESNGALIRDGGWWRPVSALWLHVSGAHLVINIGALLVVTPLSERVIGRWRTAVIVGLGGIAGAACSALLRPDSTVGISPAIAATLAAAGVAGWRHRRALPPRLVRALVGTWVMFSIIGAAAGIVDDSIDSVSHAAGWLVGAALAATLPTAVRDERPERATRVVGLALSALALFALVMMVSEAVRCGGSEAAFLSCYAAVVSAP